MKKRKILIDIRFLFATIRLRRGNGKRPAAPLPPRLSRAVGRSFIRAMFPSSAEASMSSLVQTMVGSALEQAAPLDRNEAIPHGLVGRLAGVPKGALTAVLGTKLGEMVWRHARGKVQWPE